MAFLFQFLLEFQIVFDDAVVHHDDFALAVAMRMRILLGRPSVSSPTRMTQAVDAINRIVANGLLEIWQFAGGAANLHMAVLADHGDACGVVSAVFQASQPVQDQGYNFLRANVSDDAAHGEISYSG